MTKMRSPADTRPSVVRGVRALRNAACQHVLRSSARKVQHFFHAVAEDVLHRSAQVFKLRLGFFERRFLFLGLLELQAFFGAADQLFAVVLFQLLDGVLVDRVHHVEALEAALSFDMWNQLRNDQDLNVIEATAVVQKFCTALLLSA